jgi:hypothetical protein
MSNFDLDVQNYTIEDIEEFFKLVKPYTSNDIESKEYKIRTTLLKNKNVPKNLKRDVIVFCTAAKQWLLFSKFGESTMEDHVEYQKQPSIPQQRLDVSQYPISSRANLRESELLVNNGKPYIFIDDSQYHKGDMNPLNQRVISKCLTIDTKFRDHYNKSQSSDFHIQLPSKISNVVSMQLSNFQIPMTFYNISSAYGNNYLWIYANTQEYQDGPINEYSTMIIIPDGIYTADTLIDIINHLLAPEDCDGNLKNVDNIFSYINFFLDMDEDLVNGTGRVYLEPTGEKKDTINTFGMDFTKNIEGVPDNVNIKMRLGWTLGFRYPSYFGSRFYKSETSIDVKTIKYAYLSIEDYQKSVNNLFLSAFDNCQVNDNTIARILLDKEEFSIHAEKSMNLITEKRTYFGPVDIQRLRIQLFDDYGRNISMNSTDYSFVLNFKILYDV